RTSSRSAGVPAPASSLASPIAKQPPCAAARSSSGLVFPSVAPMRVGNEYGSSVKAPDVAAGIDPAPRGAFPPQTTSASVTIRGTSASSGDAASFLGREEQACLGRRERQYWTSIGATEDTGWRRLLAHEGPGSHCLRRHSSHHLHADGPLTGFFPL